MNIRRIVFKTLAVEVGLAALLASLIILRGPAPLMASPSASSSLALPTSHLPATAARYAVEVWRSSDADYVGVSRVDDSLALHFKTSGGNGFDVVLVGTTLALQKIQGNYPRGLTLDLAAVQSSDQGEALKANEIDDVHIAPREDTEPGVAVAWDNFYTEDVPGIAGEVCHVILKDPAGQEVVNEIAYVDAPLNEAARDSYFFIELSLPPDVVNPRPEVECQTWRGPGFHAVGASRFTTASPANGRSEAGRGWVVQRLEWQGPEFPTVWECRARVENGAGQEIAEGQGRLYRNPVSDSAPSVEVAIPVELRGQPREAARSTVSCDVIQSELVT